MSFVAVVTVSICIRRDRFVRTVTVWAVGIPTLRAHSTRVLTSYPL